VIGVPFEDNDLTCLGKITEIVADLVSRPAPWLPELASRFQSTEELAAWIRSLPQRDDEGLPSDGPRVIACEPWQRLRIPADDPNCVERAALYIAVAELIDPWPVRRLATLDFDWGRHTFPIEEGEPIVLNPRVSEEELQQAVRPRKRRVAHGPVLQSEPAAPATVQPVPPPSGAPDVARADSNGSSAASVAPVAIDINDAIAYTSQLAQVGAQNVRNGPGRAVIARNAIRNLVETGTPPPDRDTVDAMGWFLATAEKQAQGYGRRALTIVRTTAYAIAKLLDDILASNQAKGRNLSFELGGTSYAIPSWLTSVGSLAGKIGLNLGAAYYAPKLAALGITGPMLDLVEQELNAEGLTLGPIARPGKSFTSALNSLSNRAV
jgi:hypothetical protein